MESDYILNFLKIVQTILRRGDITSVYGKQVLVILVGADKNGGKVVIDRVINTLHSMHITTWMKNATSPMKCVKLTKQVIFMHNYKKHHNH